uniref:CCR4-NOT transcription complex subunit 11 n=1 Tax=Ditylenchus dipsaci TaxID=166011 RepID=A0A915DSG8_9BILA
METDFNAKDFSNIYALCTRRADSFCVIGDQFCKLFRSKDSVSVCLNLVACYQECDTFANVAQRLILVYLIYRLKDIGVFDAEPVKSANEPDILAHPFLLLFVKIYVDDYHIFSKRPLQHKDSLLQHLGQFPEISSQEAGLVRRLLTDSTSGLEDLFRLSPTQVAESPSAHRKEIDISKHLELLNSQLEQLRVHGKEGVQDNSCDAKGTNTFPLLEPSLMAPRIRLVYSLAAPPFVRIEPSIMPPCEDEFRFIYPSLIEPEQVPDDWLKDEEWNQDKMRPLEKTLGSSALRISTRSSAPPSPSINMRKGQFTPEIGFSTSGNEYPPNIQNGPTEKQFSTPSSVGIAETKNHAIDCLRKIANGSGATLSRVDVAKLMAAVTEDPDIFRDISLVDEFPKFIECQPDIAAELLIHELIYDLEALSLHMEILLNLEFSVQSLVTVNKFISTSAKIPEDFLNRFISYCMVSCEQNDPNQLLTHRLVRMVCVFFATLIRLKNFDAKPRLTEMQNFSTIFLSLKEASTLYQSILQTPGVTKF